MSQNFSVIVLSWHETYFIGKGDTVMRTKNVQHSSVVKMLSEAYFELHDNM